MENASVNRFGIFALFLICGLSIFAVPAFLVEPFRTMYLIAVAVVFLLTILWASRVERLKDFRQILLAFLLASVIFLVQLFWSTGTTVEEIVLNKLITAVIVIVPIILLVMGTTRDLGDLYLKRGNLRLGLIIGAVTLLIFILTAIPVSLFLFGGQEITIDRLLGLIPWITVFVLLNGIKEELLFRGLFLKKYESFMSPGKANLLQAAVFSLAHLQPVLSDFVIIYLVLTFFLGLGFGGVMQDTDSLLGSVLFHAAADIPVILAVFSVL